MRRLPGYLTIGAWFLAAPLAAQEKPVDESFQLREAGDLVTACTVSEEHPLHDTANGFCLGYMTGAMQLYDAATASPNVEDAVCPGRIVPRAEMRAIFLSWAADHPDHMDEPAIDALLRAAVDAFPCP